MAREGWHTLPYLNVEVPFPPSELGISLITVLAFLPAVIVASNCVAWLCCRSGSRRTKTE